MKIKSVKHESILKQYYIYFLVASIVPLIILIYLIYQFAVLGRVDITGVNAKFLFFIAIVFSILGFWGTRSFIAKIVVLSNKLKEDAWDKLDKDSILELARGEGEVAHLAKVFGEITDRLEENVRQLKDTKRTLYRVLSKVGKAISSTQDSEALIQFVLETIIDALGAKRGVIFFFEEDKLLLKPKVICGIEMKDAPQEVKFGEEAVGWVAKERKPLFVPLLEEKKTDSLFSPPLMSAPLIVHDKLWGVISLSGKKESDNFSEEELKILSNLAYQIAVCFENAKLNEDAERTYFETIAALALAVEAKDPYSRGHSERVSEYAIKIAENMGLTQQELDILRDAAKLHDIGKIGIIDEILHKPAKLSDEEEAIMHKHPLIGESIVRPLRSFAHILNPIMHHHEFLDGSGYPYGLKEENIPLITRILTVADIFDALTTERSYRKALTKEEAKKELEMMVDKRKIDKSVAGSLFNLIDTKKI